MSIFFAGKRVVKPQAVSRLDTSQLANATAGSANRLVIIGQAEGGEPHKLLSFSSPSAARSILRGGEALRAARLAWTPSPSQPGASVVNVIRVNSAKQALNAVDLLDKNNKVVLIGRSKDYGDWTKDIKVKFNVSTAMKAHRKASSVDSFTGITILDVDDETAPGALYNILKKAGTEKLLSFNGGPDVEITGVGEYFLKNQDDGGILIEVKDMADINNIALKEEESIDISYVGVDATVSYYPENAIEFQQNLGSLFSISYTGPNNCALSIVNGILTTSTGVTQNNLSIDLSDVSYNTVLKLVNHINAQPSFEATLSPYLINANLSSAYIDSITSTVEIKERNHTISGYLGTIIDWAETNSIFVTFEYPTIPSSYEQLNTYDGSQVHTVSGNLQAVELTGNYDVDDNPETSPVSLEGTNTFSDWLAVLAILETEEIDIIVPMSVNIENIIAVKEHVATMSRSKRERRAYYGHALNLSVKEVQSISRELGSNQGVLASPGIKLRDDDGSVNLYDSSYLAVCYAGIAAGSRDIATPLTGKYVNIIGLEKTYSEDEVSLLLDGGVAPIEFKRNKGYRITQGRTTYLLDTKSFNVEDSVNRVGVFIARDIREYLEDIFVGKKATPATINAIAASLTSKLDSYERSGIITSGVDPDTNQAVAAYRNVSVRFDDRVAYVEFECSPVEPINYIPIVAVLRPAAIVI